MSVHQETLQGLQEALDFVKGDKTKARAVTVTISDEEIEFHRTYRNLSKINKNKTIKFVNDLLKVSNQ